MRYKLFFKPFSAGRRIISLDIEAETPKKAEIKLKRRYPKSELVAVFYVKEGKN